VKGDPRHKPPRKEKKKPHLLLPGSLAKEASECAFKNSLSTLPFEKLFLNFEYLSGTVKCALG
jgi:hypothetical protein